MTCQGQAWLLVAASAANAVIAPASLIGVKEVKLEVCGTPAAPFSYFIAISCRCG